jgi:molybdopterin-biosynthesis enzyme MoeA-like protein
MAKAFDLPLKLDAETVKRMRAGAKARGMDIDSQTEEQKTARNRMAMLPTGDAAECIFVAEDKWVPVVRLGGKVSSPGSRSIYLKAYPLLYLQLCIFPGIPSLFEQLLISLTPYLPLPPDSAKPFRLLVFTEQPESSIAPYLTELHERERKNGIRCGSYPMLYKGKLDDITANHSANPILRYSGVHVSLIGLDEARIREIGEEVNIFLVMFPKHVIDESCLDRFRSRRSWMERSSKLRSKALNSLICRPCLFVNFRLLQKFFEPEREEFL